MLVRLRNRVKFQIEQLLLRGAHARLLFVASLVGVVAIGGGAAVRAMDATFDGHVTAIWWAFLRLTDPGYLGNDEGVARRVISTALTVLGYVLFMGSLIAILTQWLNQKIRNFERGLTPIVRRNHILILGWTNRTSAIVDELMRSEGRVRRFLQRRGARGFHVVILSDDVNLERIMELRRALGPLWSARKITFRSGIPLRMKHLERVDFQNASAIILPGADFAYGSANESDTRILKTVLSIANQPRSNESETLPFLVTELFDPAKVQIARQAYRGVLEILASDVFITRCITQNVRHPGLSQLLYQILSHGHGNSIYIRTGTSLAGYRFGDIIDAQPRAVVLGIVRPHGDSFRSMLNPPTDLVLDPQDRLVFLAREYEDCEIPRNLPHKRLVPQAQRVLQSNDKGKRRILVLGWNHKIVPLLKEFDTYLHERFEVSILSLIPAIDRKAELRRKGVDDQRVRTTHCEGDHTSRSDLEGVVPNAYDNVVILGSDWLETHEESDARAIVGHMVLKDILGESIQKPKILIELNDADNVGLLQRENIEVLVTPMIASHVLAQVALRRELNVVYAELFGAGGAEIIFRPVLDYGIVDQEMDFRKLQDIVTGCGEIALGFRVAGGSIELNPARNRAYLLKKTDDLIVLAREEVA